jgi:Uma2 family endonuclease
MTALLELPAFRERVHGLSVEDYHRLGELGILSTDVELLRGIVVTKMPKTPLHELVAQKLLHILIAHVPKGFTVRPERPLTTRDSEPEPDISVVRGKPDDWVRAHPSTAELVVEVAVSSVLFDARKGEIYAEAGVPEYWVVRAEERELDVYSTPTREGYACKNTLREKDVLVCKSLTGIQFTVAEILPASV